MNTDRYEDLISGFFKYLIKYKSSFIKKYNSEILKLKNIFFAHMLNTNKTTFVITECFFIKLMTIYSLDNINPNNKVFMTHVYPYQLKESI